MKATLNLLLILLMSCIIACKKENKNNNTQSLSTTFSPAYVSPTTPGKIVVSAQILKLHVNDQAQLTAQLYNSDGSLSSAQPSFSWISNNSTSVTANNGNITAISEGFALLTISDGSHGDEFVRISVVADTVKIPAGPANIAFSTSVLGMNLNETKSIPQYTITDYKGQTIGITPQFEISNKSGGVLVNGTNIQAGSTTGGYQLKAMYNSAYLTGSLPILVHGSTTDTTTSFSVVFECPPVFEYYNVTSPAIKIQVTKCWNAGSGVVFNCFQTSPDQITIENTNIVGVTGDGHLISKAP
jgi:hypothetical protein